ncbi:unnamed protein product [Phytophthora fragariaefolia]|uniref:Unnamed protein product n=1 Tax=Phytophthora fragariaefolia TaxID=1490495 RepID=A0A9W6TU65_9STRA|nr:unnamed protein product [Phytophthora fragariaefolia]
MKLRAHAAQKHHKHSSASEGSKAQNVSDDSWSEESNCRTSRSDASIQFETLNAVSDTGSSVTHADGSGASSSHASCHQTSLVRAVPSALKHTQFDSWEPFHEYLVKYMAQSYQINACVRLVHGGIEDPVFAVFVTRTTLEHNQAVGRVNYEQHASVRTSLTLQTDLQVSSSTKTLVANLVSEHACNLSFEQYDFVVSVRAKYLHYESSPGFVFVQNKGAEDDESFDGPNVKRNQTLQHKYITPAPQNDSVTELSVLSDIHDDADPSHNSVVSVDTLPIPSVIDPVYMPSLSNDGLTLTCTDVMVDQPTEVDNQPAEVGD